MQDLPKMSKSDTPFPSMNLDDITKHKKAVDTFLLEFLRAKRVQNSGSLHHDALLKLEQFVTSGKSIRGSLVLFTTEAMGRVLGLEAIKVAAGIELIHSALLIQDDIMDRDTLRRGKPTLHTQYASQIKETADAEHYGTSMAINIADLSLFYGYELMGAAPQGIYGLISHELALVAAGQMQDVNATFASQILNEEEILTLYKNKTARYTFSLPMMVGAHLAASESSEIAALEMLGEKLGLIFQIHDDELNIMGDEKVTGKSTASDIASSKQTLLALHWQKEQALQELQALTPKKLKEAYIKSETQKYLASVMDNLYKEVIELIDTLPFDHEHKDILVRLAQFLQTRKN